jgi:hypothetical protein
MSPPGFSAIAITHLGDSTWPTMIYKLTTLPFICFKDFFNLIMSFTTITTCFLISHELDEGLYRCLMMIQALFSFSNIVCIIFEKM